MSETSVRQTESTAEEIESFDSDSDEHYDVAQKCFIKAEGKFSLNQRAEAGIFSSRSQACGKIKPQTQACS